ncbi:pol II transcription elongation factor [Rhizoctonia solani AG-1 IA]|uniref:Elongator complex protein 1 n=1 Tax=Thanatephorus cucumeris (strain AG1-IA) TaxID=983506 RepID=L8WNA1_THACA|nr:pol II transcription elongation factor [Rhizoctonia solani AG-1 IA]
MRNLSILSYNQFTLPQGNRAAYGVALDIDTNLTYVATQRNLAGGGTDIEIWQLPTDDESIPLATITPDSVPKFEVPHQVVSFTFLAESRQLVVILAGGDIAVLALDNASEFDIIGSVEPGIKAASWSPDESQLVLVNGNDELLVMSKDFDVQFEGPLRPSDLGQEKHTTLGWGSKQTQFHGSLGKAAAVTEPSITGQGGTDKPSPDDDNSPRISWRGDGAFFVVSSLDPRGAHSSVRRLRFYSSSPTVHLSTSEYTPGLEGVLAWRPSGGLIASTQRFGYEGGGIGRQGRHDVVFFERCGLRRGEFGIRGCVATDNAEANKSAGLWSYKVKELLWNADSSILALWVEHANGDSEMNHSAVVDNGELPLVSEARDYTTWYFFAIYIRYVAPRGCSATHLYHKSCVAYTNSVSADSSGCVAVVDGSSILITPFKLQNVPPPMSSFKIDINSIATPSHLAFSADSRSLAMVRADNSAQIWDLAIRTGTKGKIAQPKVTWEGALINGDSRTNDLVCPRQITLSESSVIVLGSSRDGFHDIVNITSIGDSESATLQVPRFGRLIGDSYYQDGAGQIYNIKNRDLVKLGGFPRFCAYGETIATLHGVLLVGLDSSGKLVTCALDPITGPQVNEISHSVNSFALASGFLMFTTTAHEIKFVPTDSLFSGLGEPERSLWEVRRVERGSRIVVPVPPTASVVLQLPRGNLETINPRPLVLASVRADVERGDFRRAFLTCRKHRIDLHVLVDYAPTVFTSDPAQFVDQVPEVDYLNLFLTGLGQSKRHPQEITSICDKLRAEFEQRGLARYIQSILTAHVVKTPPDVESALKVLHTLRESEPSTVEDAVKYIIFLVDGDQLFNTALGMYDFSLVLMIAQQSQKVGVEMRAGELRSFEMFYQRFRINDYLGRRELALANLKLAGSPRFEEAKKYIEKHQLYSKSIELWKDEVAEYAGFIAFSLANDSKRAMFAYEKARMWKELFSLALDTGVGGQDLIDMGHRVAESLVSHSRYSEAARVYLDYSQDVPSAVSALTRGNDLSEAFRVISINKAQHLAEEIISPEALDLCTQLREDVQEMAEQLTRQGQRLVELKEKKALDPDSYYGREEPNLHNVDALTDASGISQFTKYTKSSKKAARKAGRKGTANEEEYILASLVKLNQRLEHIESTLGFIYKYHIYSVLTTTDLPEEASQLIPNMTKISDEHRTLGRKLREDITRFEEQLSTIIEREWPSDLEGMGTVESASTTIPAFKPPKPATPKELWKTILTEV